MKRDIPIEIIDMNEPKIKGTTTSFDISYIKGVKTSERAWKVQGTIEPIPISRGISFGYAYFEIIDKFAEVVAYPANPKSNLPIIKTPYHPEKLP